jgi:integrase
MAGLQERGGIYRVFFRFHGKQRTFPLGKVSKQEAEAKAAQVDYLLLRIKQRLIELPPGMDIAAFLQHDGKPPESAPAAAHGNALLVTLRDRFLATHVGAHEKNTLYTAGIHFKHLIATLGEKIPLSDIAQADLQRHVERRSGDGVVPVTIKKEIDGFRAAWNWGRRAGLVSKEWPGKGLVYKKTAEKPPFQTREEIRRALARGKASEEREAELWDSLYLTSEELPAFLEFVRGAARHPFIYPMVCAAAHTGARRSELIRAEVADVDFDAAVFTVREKKRSKGRQTYRRVPLSPFLAAILKDWLARHPGGNFLFCHDAVVARSKKRSERTGYANGKARPTTDAGRSASLKSRVVPEASALTENEAADHFARTVRDGEWSVVPGWHALRHSFASICASRGIDQRLINAWMGHQTVEQQKRYQHLFPRQQQDAIREAFGGPAAPPAET